MELSLFSLSLSLRLCLSGAREGEELSRVEEEGTRRFSPRQGYANSLLNKLLTVCISVYVNVSLFADAGDLVPRGRSEPEHELPAARDGVCVPFCQKAFVSF